MPGHCRTQALRTPTHTSHSQILHLDEDCAKLASAKNTRRVSLRAVPPVWRDWCDRCGPR